MGIKARIVDIQHDKATFTRHLFCQQLESLSLSDSYILFGYSVAVPSIFLGLIKSFISAIYNIIYILCIAANSCTLSD